MTGTSEFRLPSPPVGSSSAYNAMAMTFFMLKRSLGHEISRVRQRHQAKNDQEHWEMDRAEIVAELLEAISETLFSEHHAAEEVLEEKVHKETSVVPTPRTESEKTKSPVTEAPFVSSPSIETEAQVSAPPSRAPSLKEPQPIELPLSTADDVVQEIEIPQEIRDSAEFELSAGLEYPSDLDFMNSDEMAKLLAEMELDVNPQFAADFDFPDVTVSAGSQEPFSQPTCQLTTGSANVEECVHLNGGGYTIVSHPLPHATDRPRAKTAKSNGAHDIKVKSQEKSDSNDSSRTKDRHSAATVPVRPAKPRTGQQVFEDLGFLSPEQPFGTNKVWWTVLLAIQWAEEQPDNKFRGWADLDRITARVNDTLAQDWSKQTNHTGLQLLLRHGDGLVKAKTVSQEATDVELYRTTEDFKNLVVYVRQLETKARKSNNKAEEVGAPLNLQQWWTYDDIGQRGAVEGAKLETRRKMGPVIRSFWKGKTVRERVERLTKDRSEDHFRFLLEFLRSVIDVQERSTGDKHGWYHIYKPGYAHISLVADRFTAGLSKEQDRTLKFFRVRDIAADAVKYELVTVIAPRKAKEPEFYQRTEDLMDLLVFVAGQESFRKMLEAAHEDDRFKQVLMAIDRENE